VFSSTNDVKLASGCVMRVSTEDNHCRLGVCVQPHDAQTQASCRLLRQSSAAKVRSCSDVHWLTCSRRPASVENA
jgi:hypothetical protein